MLDSEAPDYRILDTDYSSYAAVYSCDDFIVEKAEIGAVLSRDRMVPESIVSKSRSMHISKPTYLLCPKLTNLH